MTQRVLAQMVGGKRMKQYDAVTKREAVVAAKRTHPVLRMRQIAAKFDVSKSGTGCERPIFFEANMDNANNPEVLAVVPLPTAEGRRRREIMLARVMLVAVDT